MDPDRACRFIVAIPSTPYAKKRRDVETFRPEEKEDTQKKCIFVSTVNPISMKTKLFLLTLAMAIFCGCSSSYSISTSPYQLAIGKTTYISNYRVFQTINTHFVLVVNSNTVANRLIIAIKSSDESSPFYDGQIISGSFVMIDTYTYETVPDANNRTFIKTVPLVIPRKEYNSK